MNVAYIQKSILEFVMRAKFSRIYLQAKIVLATGLPTPEQLLFNHKK